jgi:hypothetical protein
MYSSVTPSAKVDEIPLYIDTEKTVRLYIMMNLEITSSCIEW